MKLLVDVHDESISTEELAQAIGTAMLDAGMGGPKVSITNLDVEVDPVYDGYIHAGLECIELAPFMYDGCIYDTVDAIKDMTKQEAKERVEQINKMTQVLADVVAQLNFDRALIFQRHEEW